MFQPQRVLITRHGTDRNHERLQLVPGLMVAAPNVGDSMQMFFDSGRIMLTTPVTSVANDGADLVVDTQNSRYSLKRAS